MQSDQSIQHVEIILSESITVKRHADKGQQARASGQGKPGGSQGETRGTVLLALAARGTVLLACAARGTVLLAHYARIC